MMGRATILVANEVMDRIRDPNGEIAKRVSLISKPVRFCEETTIATIESPLLKNGYHGMMEIIIDPQGVVSFKSDADVDLR